MMDKDRCKNSTGCLKCCGKNLNLNVMRQFYHYSIANSYDSKVKAPKNELAAWKSNQMSVNTKKEIEG